MEEILRGKIENNGWLSACHLILNLRNIEKKLELCWGHLSNPNPYISRMKKARRIIVGI